MTTNVMRIATADGSERLVTGQRARLKVGDKTVLFFIHSGTDTLSHFASGYRFGGLNAVKVEHMCVRGHHARMSNRTAAQLLIDKTIARVGIDKVRDVMNAAPVLNTHASGSKR
jgi:hypothetical protein